MKNEESTSNWDHSDPRWQGCEYIDYVPITGPVTMITCPRLNSITRVRFAPEQPAEFAHFAGRFTDLGIENLGLDHKEEWRMRFGLATTGVRVPGTHYVLRVARPWYAYFEERPGEFHALPEYWMEGVRLVHCPGGGIEWLGRRHPMANSAWFDHSGFTETRSGWKWPRADFPESRSGPLGLERACVLVELHTFERSLLPALAKREPAIFPDKRVDGGYTTLQPLADWQAAARRLFQAVAADRSEQPIIYNAAQFQDFIGGEPDFAYDFQKGRIRYFLKLKSWDWRSTRHRLPEQHQPQDPNNKEQVLAAMKQWVSGPLTGACDLWNALHGTLPTLAVNDTDFVRQILRPRLWCKRVQDATVLTDEERRHELTEIHAFLDDRLSGVVAHVVGAMAANHFMQIQPFLRHPSLHFDDLFGLPIALFGALFAKAQVIIDLMLCWGQLMGPQETEPTEADNER